MSSKVSIITPCYNAEEFLISTYLSIRNQTFSDWEWIIVDDCSTDESWRLIEGLAQEDFRVHPVKLSENSGAAVSRNTGIEKASGRYIAFLDSDDMWLPKKLETQIKFMQEHDVVLSFSAYQRIDEQGNLLERIGVPKRVSYTDLLKVCSIGCLTAVYDVNKVGKVYMPLIRKRQDLGLWLKILKQVPYAYSFPEVLALYRVRKDSISSNKRVAASYTWKLYREVENLSFLKAVYYFSWYAFNGILRSKFPKAARFIGVLK